MIPSYGDCAFVTLRHLGAVTSRRASLTFYLVLSAPLRDTETQKKEKKKKERKKKEEKKKKKKKKSYKIPDWSRR